MVDLLEAECLRVEMVPLQPQPGQFAEQAVHGPAGGKEIRGERNPQRRQRDGGELVLVIDARPAEAGMAGSRLARPDRKSVGSGKSVSTRMSAGGSCIINKKHTGNIRKKTTIKNITIK